MPLNSSKEAMCGIFTAQIHWIKCQKASEVRVSSRAEHEGIVTMSQLVIYNLSIYVCMYCM